jgi:hypothetical protein
MSGLFFAVGKIYGIPLQEKNGSKKLINSITITMMSIEGRYRATGGNAGTVKIQFIIVNLFTILQKNTAWKANFSCKVM